VSSGEAVEAFTAALLDDDPTALYERAPCGYLSSTPDGTIVKVNQTFLTLTGFARSDLVGRRTFAELLSPGGRIYHETHYSPMLRMHGTAREIALDIVRADGERLPVLVNAVLERDASGDPVVVRTAVFDATDRRRYEQELLLAKERAEASEVRATSLARTLQQTLIPPTPPQIRGLDIAAVYQPAGAGEEVGGDFYDIFEAGPGDWVVALGDVCGKGVEAAVVTALARHTIRAAAVNERSPSGILATLNEVLLGSDTDRFCTVALVRLVQVDGIWRSTICRAGHPPPLLTVGGGEPTPVAPTGSLLGIFAEPRLHDTDVELPSGARLLLYTDGVTEARAGKAFFGDERLRSAAHRPRATARDIAGGLLDEIARFQLGELSDDVAIVAIRIP
jgi:sigma-B regulation protein RsbU (phosphoserine phosphatase)